MRRRPLHPIRSSLAALLVITAGGVGLVSARSDTNLPSVEARLEVAEGAAYLKHPLRLKLIFMNNLQEPVTIEGEAFLPEAFTLLDPRGRPLLARAGKDDPADHSAAEPLTIPGLGPAERIVDLGSAYARATARRKTWEIAWSHGPWSAAPIRVPVIKPFDPEEDRIAILETDLGRITWTLMPEHAPEHVKHFVDLVRQGHYDGLTFHRYIPQLQAEGGDPKGDGTGGWDRLLPGELAPDLVPQTGFVGAMRRETSMTSHTQFFITLYPAPSMQGRQTFFAKVTDGYEVIARMNQIPRMGGAMGVNAYLLKEPVRIQKISIR